MGFLSKLGKLDPLGSKLHKYDPLGKYDIAGSAIYGSGVAPQGGAGGQFSPSVSGWSTEMQALHDYYARPMDQGGIGLSGQQAVGWNPGMLTQGQILDQFGRGVGGGGGFSPAGWMTGQVPQQQQQPQQQATQMGAPAYAGYQRPARGGFGQYGGGMEYDDYQPSYLSQFGQPAYGTMSGYRR